MYAATIKKALNTHETQHFFRDVRSADQLPPQNRHGVYVVNTHPQNKPGEHWVSVEYTPTHIYYFDPYGLPPHPNIWKQLKRTTRPIIYNNIRRQGLRKTCGFYCIYHTLTRSSPQYTMDIFNTDYDFNDRLVYILVTQKFNVNKPILN